MELNFLDEKKSLACVHCGLCLASCPTYLETGNENSSPRGRVYLMRALQSGQLSPTSRVTTHIDECLGCRACETACPSGVEYGQLLESTRDHLEHHIWRSPFQWFLRRVLIEQLFPYPNRFRWAIQPALWIKKLRLDSLIPSRWRGPLNLIPDNIETGFVPVNQRTKQSPSRGRAALVTGCVMQVLFPQTHASTVRLLNIMGYDVVVPKGQSCCGALHAHGGQLDKAREQARLNIGAFEDEEVDTIVINAAGCGSTLKAYHHLLEKDPDWSDKARRFVSKVRDLSELLVDHPLESTELKTKGEKITYHDACHLAHAQGISMGPKKWLKQCVGEDYIELPEADICCGSAGSYNLTQPQMADRLQQRKSRHILSTQATTVITTNPGCILQIQAGLKQAGRDDIRVRHLADFALEILS